MIPIYRAKNIDSDEWVEGYYAPAEYNCHIIEVQKPISNGRIHWIKIFIDKNTLAIHFPNMIDKNGKKIFASLDQRSMIGGDKFIFDDKEYIYRFGEHGLETVVDTEWIDRSMAFNYHFVEVIGIHKGEENG